MNRILRRLIFIVLFVAILNPASTAFTRGAYPANPSLEDITGPVEVFSPDGTIARLPAPVSERSPVRPAQKVSMSDVVTVEENGPSANRMDVVFLGDGYTNTEMNVYSTHVTSKWDMIFTLEPYKTYREYFNAYRVNVISTDSGVTNDPDPGIVRNTALGAYFWCGGMERLLCVNTSAVWNYAQQAPAVDRMIVLANSTKYGGAGYANMATASGGSGSSGWILVHEMGHSIGGLGDEYEYASSAYSGAEPLERNVSIYNSANMQARGTKWFRWLNEPSPDCGTIWTYEGAYPGTSGVYRPTEDSLMRTLGKPYNMVGMEALVIAFYQQVRPIDASTPTNNVLPGTGSIFVTPMQPAGHNLNITWYLNGQPIQANQDKTTFNLSNLPPSCASTHTVSAVVVDNSAMVRDPAARAQFLTDRRDWTVQAQQLPDCRETYLPAVAR